jgi:AAA+ ATPase superfamily predicted ATPase
MVNILIGLWIVAVVLLMTYWGFVGLQISRVSRAEKEAIRFVFHEARDWREADAAFEIALEKAEHMWLKPWRNPWKFYRSELESYR